MNEFKSWVALIVPSANLFLILFGILKVFSRHQREWEEKEKRLSAAEGNIIRLQEVFTTLTAIKMRLDTMAAISDVVAIKVRLESTASATDITAVKVRLDMLSNDMERSRTEMVTALDRLNSRLDHNLEPGRGN